MYDQNDQNEDHKSNAKSISSDGTDDDEPIY